MPYVSDYRSSGSLVSTVQLTPSSFPDPGGWSRTDTTTDIDAVYSFRTGKRADSSESAAVKLDPLSESYQPPKGLVEALAYRKKFIERSMTSILSRPGTPTHFLLGDMGHEFGSFKARFQCAPNRVTGRVIATGLDQSFTFTNVHPRTYREPDALGIMRSTFPYFQDPFGFFEGKGFPFFSTGTGIPMSVLRATGTSHISEMNPYRPKASILSTLLELARGDIPGILTSLRRHMITIQGIRASGVKEAGKALGSEFLNNQFGWTPIIKDVDRAIRLLLELDSLVFKSDSTRRKVSRVISQQGFQTEGFGNLWGGSGFRDSITTYPGTLFVTSHEGSLGTAASGQFVGDYSFSETFSVNTSARFSVGVRPTTTNNGYLDRAIELLGLELTPQVIWELTPWSWLIDWFLNIGTQIQNLSTLGLSNTILNYAYSTGRVERFHSSSGRPVIEPSNFQSHLTGASGDFLWTWKEDHKVRIAASPFGFGVDLNALTGGQWSILAALGLARSR